MPYFENETKLSYKCIHRKINNTVHHEFTYVHVYDVQINVYFLENKKNPFHDK